MVKRILKFRAITFREKMLFIEALFLQLIAGLLLRVIPFRWVPGLLARAQGTGDSGSGTRNEEQEMLFMLKAAARRAVTVSPWKNKCLVQSLSLRLMLNRRGIASHLSFGVAKGENGKVVAHSWIKVGDFELVERGGEYRELYLF
jgi:hypothetical protein